MRLLTTAEKVLVKLEITQVEWAFLTEPELKSDARTKIFPITQFELVGFTIEQFERGGPLDDVTAYGTETSLGPVISVWTAYWALSTRPFVVGYRTGRTSYLRRRFMLDEAERNRFLRFEQPFKHQDMFT